MGDWALGRQRLFVIRVDFDDLPGPPQDAFGVFMEERLMETVNGPVNRYYRIISYDKAGVELEREAITRVLRLPDTAEAYAQEPRLNRLQADALAAAATAGYDAGAYDRVAVLLSSLDRISGIRSRSAGSAGLGAGSAGFKATFRLRWWRTSWDTIWGWVMPLCGRWLQTRAIPWMRPAARWSMDMPTTSWVRSEPTRSLATAFRRPRFIIWVGCRRGGGND